FSFEEEMRKALELESEANAKEQAGSYGEAIAIRTRILDEFPFDRALTDRSEKERDRRAQLGRKAIGDVEHVLADAPFFLIPDEFRRARDEAEKLAKSYPGTDIADRAKLVVDTVDKSVAGVEAQRQQKTAQRLEVIAGALDAAGAKELSAYMREYLAKHFP